MVLLIALAAIGLAVWRVLAAMLPKWLEQSEARNATLVKAMSEIPRAIADFERALLSGEVRIIERIDEAKDEIVKEVRDDRLHKLAQDLHALPPGPPASTRGPMGSRP